MTNSTPVSRFQELVDAARERVQRTLRGRPQIIVQVGHCSASVGASDLPDAIHEQYGGRASITVAGCDGSCFAAPTVLVQCRSGDFIRLERVDTNDLRRIGMALRSESPGAPSRATKFIESQHRLSLEGCGNLDAESIDDYLAHGGYSSFVKALQSDPDDVIRQVKDSRLRGRGGAYFPAGLKWESARGFSAPNRYLIVNCEEGEPGLFKDRHLMEGLPHRLIEGACIAAFACDAQDVIFYINAEANLSAQRIENAVEQARELGLVGDNVLDSGLTINVEVRRGAGGYVCGEETTLINTIEGYRREPRIRPPYPVESGLWSQPTVINNAETLASVPYIVTHGADTFTQIGDGTDTGTKIINLSGAVRRPGLIEVPIGTTLRNVIYDIGGGPPNGASLKIIGVGGPSSGIFPVSMLDTPIRPGALHDSGVMLGAGAVIAMDDSMDVLSIVLNLALYNANESCGKCTPCREGTPRMVETLDAIAVGQASKSDVDQLENLARTVNVASLCGLGQAAGNPILSGLYFFGEEMRKTLEQDWPHEGEEP